MKQVDSNRYNKEYFIRVFGQSRYLEDAGYFASEQHSIYQEIAGLVEINPADTVVDYGCGNGNLTFYLASRFRCKIIGIDYSKEAIDICNEKLSQVSNYSAQIKFINCNNNDYVYDFRNIKIVFFCDVLEHMFDEEIETLLKQVKKWNINDEVKIAVHTDSNHYLKFINPFFNLLNILLRKKSLNQIKKESKIDRELHVNLTTPQKLRNKMEKWGYRQVVLRYPSPTEARVKKQLGGLQSIPYLSKMCVYMLKRFGFLSPTFCAVYEKK